MRRSAVAAVLLAASVVPAEAATVDVWNVMTANPYGARITVEDVRYADGAVLAGPRAVGRGLQLGGGSVTSFVIVAATQQSGIAFALRCAEEPAFARIEIENPWTVVATGACTVARRGTVDPAGAIIWE